MSVTPQILYLYKSRKNWNDSIYDLGLYLSVKYSVDINDGKFRDINIKKYDIIIINHWINLLKLIIYNPFYSFELIKKNVILLEHEGEICLRGLDLYAHIFYLLRNMKLRIILYVPFYIMVLKIFVNKIIGLSSISVIRGNASHFFHLLNADASYVMLKGNNKTQVKSSRLRVFCPFAPTDHIKNPQVVKEAVAGKAFDLKFAESFSHDEMLELYSWCSVVLLPSRVETYSLAALEAIYCGCDLLITENAGVLDIISEYVEKLKGDHDYYELSVRTKTLFIKNNNELRQKVFDHIQDQRSQFADWLLDQ